MKLTEALELLKDHEALRIRTAQEAGWDLFVNLLGIVGKAPDSLFHKEICAFNFHDLAEAERRLGLHDRANVSLRVKWVNFLHDILAAQPDCPVNKVGNPLVSDIDKLLAPVEVRCLAFVMAAEWKAKQDGKGVAA